MKARIAAFSRASSSDSYVRSVWYSRPLTSTRQVYPPGFRNTSYVGSSHPRRWQRPVETCVSQCVLQDAVRATCCAGDCPIGSLLTLGRLLSNCIPPPSPHVMPPRSRPPLQHYMQMLGRMMRGGRAMRGNLHDNPTMQNIQPYNRVFLGCAASDVPDRQVLVCLGAQAQISRQGTRPTI